MFRKTLVVAAFTLMLCSVVAAEPTVSLRLTAYSPPDGPVRMVMRLENFGTQTAVIPQSSGQTHDFVIRRGDQVVWRWSEHRFFLQALGAISVEPGEIQVYEGVWDKRMKSGKAAPKGHYTVTGEVPRRDGATLKTQPRDFVIQN